MTHHIRTQAKAQPREPTDLMGMVVHTVQGGFFGNIIAAFLFPVLTPVKERKDIHAILLTVTLHDLTRLGRDFSIDRNFRLAAEIMEVIVGIGHIPRKVEDILEHHPTHK